MNEMMQIFQTGGFNILLFLIMGASFFLMFRRMGHQKKVTELFDVEKMQAEIKEHKKGFPLFKGLQQKIALYYFFKPNKSGADLIFASVLLAEFGMLVGFIIAKKYLLAIAFPLIFHWFVNKVLDLLTVNIHMFIEKELPFVIKHLIKTMTKTNDMKTVMFETSRVLRDPLRTKFNDLSRRLVTDDQEKTLLEFAEELDNIWIYAFVFILLSYKEQSKKEDVIINLTILADMLEKEAYIKEKGLTDKKPVVMLNYVLGLFGVGTFVANLMMNDHAYNFFFNSMTGMISMIAGFFSILGTILINLILTRKTF